MAAVAAELGMSFLPVSEALLRLEFEGLLPGLAGLGGFFAGLLWVCTRLLPLRDELLRGDTRPLYLGWLVLKTRSVFVPMFAHALFNLVPVVATGLASRHAILRQLSAEVPADESHLPPLWLFLSMLAVGAGLLTYLIRVFGGYPDGVAFAVLLMNICVPLIDMYTQPPVFGEKTKEKEA